MTHGKTSRIPKIRPHTYRDPIEHVSETWFLAFAAAAAVILAALLAGCAASGALGQGAQATSGAEGNVRATVNVTP